MPGGTVALCRAVHIAAAVVWLGGMFMNMRVVMPTARKHLSAADLMQLHTGIHQRFARVVYISIALLLASGAYMTHLGATIVPSADTRALWSGIMAAKHGLFLVMGGIAVYILSWLVPTVARLAAAPDSEAKKARLAALRSRQHRLVRLNLWLSAAMLLISSAAQGIHRW